MVPSWFLLLFLADWLISRILPTNTSQKPPFSSLSYTSFPSGIVLFLFGKKFCALFTDRNLFSKETSTMPGPRHQGCSSAMGYRVLIQESHCKELVLSNQQWICHCTWLLSADYLSPGNFVRTKASAMLLSASAWCSPHVGSSDVSDNSADSENQQVSADEECRVPAD